MALEKTITTKSGLVAENAYHRVENVKIERKDAMSFKLVSYVNPDASFPAFYEQTFRCAYDLSKSNPIAQAYVFVKTQDEMANAKDC